VGAIGLAADDLNHFTIGEILLIVIGTLIAVQLSNLDDQRRAWNVSYLERSYLERIASDIRSNVAKFSDDRETEPAGSRL
jgi:hypothetical protein